MGAFSEAWLALREPFDHAARSERLARAFAAALPPGATVVELGGGTGSGARYLRRFTDARFVVVDHDPELLARVRGAEVLSHDLRDLAGLSLAADGVGCQALLDLCDAGWLQTAAAWIAARRAPVLAALTVDGRVAWDPVDPDDAAVQAAFRLHQLGDRGFGASPGPRAAAVFTDALLARGYRVTTEAADWSIPADATARVAAMIDGTAEAAAEVHPEPARVVRWRERRRSALGRVALAVGHVDVLGLPPSGNT